MIKLLVQMKCIMLFNHLAIYLNQLWVAMPDKAFGIFSPVVSKFC